MTLLALAHAALSLLLLLWIARLVQQLDRARRRARLYRARWKNARVQLAELRALPAPVDPWADEAEARRAYQNALLARGLDTIARDLYKQLEQRR